MTFEQPGLGSDPPNGSNWERGATPPIIHRDVKSSNILLDSQFNTEIANFGLAKMLLAKQEGPT